MLLRILRAGTAAGALFLAACCGGPGEGGACRTPGASAGPTPALGVTPKDCRFIEGGHGWR
jgi:hypothetical protein